MIDVLIAGKLHKDPVQRTSKAGKPFVTASMKISQTDGSLVFVSLVAFEQEPARKLAALTAGDSLSVQGGVTAKVWQDSKGEVHPSLDVVVAGVLSAYAIKKKREAMQQAPAPARPVPAPAAGWERMYQRNGNTVGEIKIEYDPL